MTVDEIEEHVQETASRYAFIRAISTIDKTDHAIKIRLYILPAASIVQFNIVELQTFRSMA